MGERAWPSLDALPERPDHVYVLTTAEPAIEAVEQCGRLGIPIVTVLADGFAAAGGVGAARVARLKQICARSSVRVVGPSSLGVVDLRSRLMLTANAAFAEDLPVGKIFAASQSGSLIGALVSRGKARGIGFAGLVSVGNEVDLGVGEICTATLDDPDITGYLLFLETIRHADALRRFAIEAEKRGKPIVAYKLGRSPEARELTVTHTGALAGEDDVADAFFRECGIARVDTFEALLESLPLLARLPRTRAGAHRPAVGVVTTTAGGAAMVVDRLGVRGIDVVPPTSATIERLASAGVAIEPGRIVDLTLAGTRYDVMKAALDCLLTAPEFDLVIAVVGSSARSRPELAVKPVIDSAGTGKPLAAFLVPDAPDALMRLMQAGVPSFRTPESCADAVAAALSRHVPTPVVETSQRRSASGGGVLDEFSAYALLDSIGVPRAPYVTFGIDLYQPPHLPFAYPVVVKVSSPDIPHKTEAGGVVLDVRDGEALVRAFGELERNLAERRPEAWVCDILVQPMVRGLGEALVGYRVDREVGPIVVLAAGGILTELYNDRAVRLAPVDLGMAHEMIAAVHGLKAFSGYRGRPTGDLDALAKTIVALSGLATSDPAVIEAEINPLIIQGHGVIAVDVLVRSA